MTENNPVEATDEQKLVAIKTEVEEYLYNNQEVIIDSPAQYTKAGDIVQLLKDKIKFLDNARMERTRPLDDLKKKLKGDYDAVIEPISKFVSEVQNKMLAFAREQQAKADAEQKRLEAEALEQAKKDNVSEVTVPVVNTEVNKVKGSFSSTNIRKDWTWKVVDETKVPREYLCLDNSKITKAVKAGLARKVEGLEIYQEESIGTRRR